MKNLILFLSLSVSWICFADIDFQIRKTARFEQSVISVETSGVLHAERFGRELEEAIHSLPANKAIWLELPSLSGDLQKPVADILQGLDFVTFLEDGVRTIWLKRNGEPVPSFAKSRGAFVMIRSNERILIVAPREKNPSGKTMVGFPGGTVEAHESFEDAAVREVLEETNIAISKEELVQVGSVTTEKRDAFRYVGLSIPTIADEIHYFFVDISAHRSDAVSVQADEIEKYWWISEEKFEVEGEYELYKGNQMVRDWVNKTVTYAQQTDKVLDERAGIIMHMIPNLEASNPAVN